MKTTEQWWAEVSSDPAKMIDWLKDQYHGEATAAIRIRELIEKYPDISERDSRFIYKIAADEEKHAKWIKALLEARGIPAEILEKEERYWSKVLPTEDVSFEVACAIGYHAETMRLDRINLLAQEPRFEDISRTFKLIRTDELFHQMAFGMMSTPEAIEATKEKHQSGLNALGLVA